MYSIFKKLQLASLLFLLVSCTQETDQNQADVTAEKQVEQVAQESSANVSFADKVASDIKRFKGYFVEKFPSIDVHEFKDGAYAIDEAKRQQWLDIEEFPPYEFSIEEGEEAFSEAFSNGKSYADCFENGGEGIRQNFPYFDTDANQVITLELAINQCRETNGEEPLAYGQGEIANISAYMAYTSRDEVFDIKVPNEAAYKAYLEGKKFYYSKRGQLNFSCADCHLRISGSNLRAELLSPGIGQTTGTPIYRAKWGEIGSLGRRYKECNLNVRAQPFDYQSEAYRNLEYFQTIMSKGFTVNGPSSRR